MAKEKSTAIKDRLTAVLMPLVTDMERSVGIAVQLLEALETPAKESNKSKGKRARKSPCRI